MIDPFTLATGVVGILGLAIQVAQITSTYVDGVRYAPEYIENFRRELDSLTKVLEKLDSFLKNERAKGPAFDELAVLCTTRHACEAKLTDCLTKLKTSTEGGRVAQALHRVKWPLDADATRAIVADLGRYTATFHFALNIEGCALRSQTSDQVSQVLTVQLQTLRKAQEVTQAIPDLQLQLTSACQDIKRVIGVTATSEFADLKDLVTDSFGNVEQRLRG